MSTNTAGDNYWLCPLYSFRCYPDYVDLVKRIQIRRIAREFQNYLYQQYSDWFWTDPSEAEYTLIFPSSPSESGSLGTIIAEHHQSDLLVSLTTALRLCHHGMVSPGPLVLAKLQGSTFVPQSSLISHSELSRFPPGMEIGPILTSVSRDGADLFAAPLYELQQADVPIVNDLLVNLLELNDKSEPDNLSIALRRFNSAYHGNIEDRLVDHIIALEFLYLGHEQELKYRLALRTAYLLGRDESERKVIFNKMRKAYNVRSDIVHGNRQVDRVVLEEIVTDTEEYLRRSIRRFLRLLAHEHTLRRLRQDSKTTIAKLDENILSNGMLLSETSQN